ncbi:MAG: UDP-N-acetylmuramate dehydrogenase [Bacteriovoracaceae bacterium]|nr:UDP-N-acetylmuramate dehydrogenase [Bacteriovoracaceae bacterium]
MSLETDLRKIGDIDVLWDTDLTSYSTFRLSCKGSLVKVKTIDALKNVLHLLNSGQHHWRVLGWGANQVLRPNESDVLIQLNFKTEESELTQFKSEYKLAASVGLNQLVSLASKFSLKGWEVLTGIPASLGGAIYMNAGTALGEISEIVKDVQLMNSKGEIRTETITAKSFSYRKNNFVKSDEIIVSATLIHRGVDQSIPEKIKQYMDYRKNSQPLATKNCGCVFKNFSTKKQAGRLIDLSGLKGLTVGAVRVSNKHANFMENFGGASSDEFFELTHLINLQMELLWGIEFELEVKAV